MRILIVEDNMDEQQRATEAVEAAGHTVMWMTQDLRYGSQHLHRPQYDDREAYADYQRQMLAMEACDGVITDLHFLPVQDEFVYDEQKKYGEQLPPCGLLVVIDALSHGKPVVICTRGDHHGPGMAYIHDRYLMGLTRTGAFGWEDRKDWAGAVKQLEKRYST